MTPLTPKQLELLEYLRSCSISPTFTQMCSAVGIGSKSSITRLLTGLERRGFIRRTPWARSIELLDQSVPLGTVPTELLRAELDRRDAADARRLITLPQRCRSVGCRRPTTHPSGMCHEHQPGFAQAIQQGQAA